MRERQERGRKGVEKRRGRERVGECERESERVSGSESESERGRKRNKGRKKEREIERYEPDSYHFFSYLRVLSYLDFADENSFEII